MKEMFNKVVCEATWIREGFIDLILHPFPHTGRIVIAFSKDEISGELADWEKSVVAWLWENVPGIEHIYVTNGLIRFSHIKLFPNEDIVQAIKEFLHPLLEEWLETKKLLD